MIRYVLAILVLSTGVALAQSSIATLRGETPPTEQAEPPRIVPFADIGRQVRNYPEQPPVIPHDIDSYRIDLNSNKCLSCHARARTGESGAPMVSITHFMDREGQFRAAVTPRRYFCNQCHVAQHDLTPPVDNTFIDIDALLSAEEAQ